MSKGNYVPGQGSPVAKLMIIGEAPGFWEDHKKIPFVGESGDMLNEMLRYAGSGRAEVYCTNIYKYRPPNNDIKRINEILSEDEIRSSILNIWKEIEIINPNVILTLGETANYIITGQKGILKLRGSILRSTNLNKKVIPTIHPANLLPGTKSMMPYSYRGFIQLDINKAVRESRTADFNLPNRELLIAKNSLDVFKYRKRFEQESEDLVIASDIETYHSIPTCISFSYNPYISMSIPLINMKGIESFEIPFHELAEIYQIVAEILSDPRYKLVGQNFKFDAERLLNTCLMYVENYYADTNLIGHTLYPEFPLGLDFFTSIYTDEPYYKTEYKEFDPRKDPISKILRYNARDSAVTLEVYRKQHAELIREGLADFYYSYVHKQYQFYLDMEDNGYRYNLWRQKWLGRKYDLLIKKKEKEFFELIGEKPYDKFFNSPKKVKELLLKYGFPERESTDEDSLVGLLTNHTKGPHDIKAQVINGILDTRRVKKAKSTYISVPPDYDGRMRSIWNIAGTETGRSSSGKLGSKVKGGGRKIPHRPTEVGLAFQTVPERGFGSEIQSLFIADEGYELFAVDLRQAEPRIVALLSEDYDLLTAFDNGTDIHKMTASWFFSKLTEEVTKEERFIGKVGRNGGNYDMHKGRLNITIATEARRANIIVAINEKEAGRLLNVFHDYSPKIRGVYHKGIQNALRDNNRVLVSPHGRRRKFRDRWNEALFREAYATIPQATVKDHLTMAGIRIHEIEPRIQFQKESHDAFKGQYPIEIAKECRALIKYELEKEIDFSKCTLRAGKLRIPIEFKIGQDLGHMKEIKIDV